MIGGFDPAVWLPAITAALTLSNTVILWFINRRTAKTQDQVNGMKLHELAEAELRGARAERHRRAPPPIGE